MCKEICICQKKVVLLPCNFQLNEKALKNYAVHPAHQEAANTKVRPFTASRMCIDFEI